MHTPPIAIDATVVRAPLSGVHYAVRDQLLALLDPADPADASRWLPLATDPLIRQRAADLGLHAPPLSDALRRVSLRVTWQQSRLPALLRDQQCAALAAMAYTAPQRCPVPYALQVHDLIALRRPELCSRLNAMHMRTLMPGSIRGAARLIATSRTVADQLRQDFPETADRIAILPLAAAPRFQGLPADLPRPAGRDRPYILFVGVIEPKKGVATLADAYARLAETHPDVDLVLAGRVGWRCQDLVARLDSWTGPGRVQRLGYLPEADVPAHYRHAAAVVVPSEEEGFGLPVLEAMACGAPLVHSDQAAVAETAGDAGIAVPRGDADALARALARLLDSPELQAERRAAGLARARARTYTRWAQDFRQLMQAIA